MTTERISRMPDILSSKRRSKTKLKPDDQVAVKARKPIPHEFVLEALSSLSPYTRPMFGCIAIYTGEKIVLILRDKSDSAADNGVWLATSHEHHESLRREFPSMRSIQLLGKDVTGWQVLPAEAPDFEQSALRACELVLARDPRIGKVPRSRRAQRAPNALCAERKSTPTKSTKRRQSRRTH